MIYTKRLLKNKNNILPLTKNHKAVITGPIAFEKRSLLGSWTLDGDINRVESIAKEDIYIGSDCYAERKSTINII